MKFTEMFGGKDALIFLGAFFLLITYSFVLHRLHKELSTFFSRRSWMLYLMVRVAYLPVLLLLNLEEVVCFTTFIGTSKSNTKEVIVA